MKAGRRKTRTPGTPATRACRKSAFLAAILAIVISQPLTTLLFAADERHYRSAFSPVRLVGLADHPHHGSVRPGDGHSHSSPPDHDFCQICLLFGAASQPLTETTVLRPPRLRAISHPTVHSVDAQEYFQIGHPPRAPPRFA